MSSVVTLNIPSRTEDRARAAVQALTSVLAELKTLSEVDPDCLPPFALELDRADTDISLLRARRGMRTSLNDLCNKFGRAP